MALMEFDKLNNLGLIEIPEERKRSEPYESYFGDMYLTEQQVKDRILIARLLEDPIRNWLLLVLVGLTTGIAVYEEAKAELLGNLIDLGIAEVEYLEMFVNDITDSTKRNKNNDWYFSEDRVSYIAENEANTIENAKDYATAIQPGMSRKQWIGINDQWERETHRALNNLIIPIDDYFQIGEAQGLFAKDMLSEYTTLPEHPEETVNCRCSVLYLP